MTREQIRHLRQALTVTDVPVTINTEVELTPLERARLDHQHREALRALRKFARAVLEDLDRHPDEDDTIVPPEPEPVDPWAGVVERLMGWLKISVIGASLALHLVQGTLLVWLALEVFHPLG